MLRSVLKSYLQTFVFSFAIFFQGIITLPILIRVAGVEVYGTYVLLLAICSFLCGVSSFGVGYRFRRALPSIDEPRRRRELFEPQFFFQLAVLLVISFVWYLLHWNFLPALGTGPAHISWYLPCGWIFANFLLAQVTDYFRFSHRMMRFNVGASAPSYIFVTLVAIFALLHRSLSVDRLMQLQIAASLAGSLPLMIVMFREIGIPKPNFPWKVILDDIRVGFPISFEYVVDYLLSSSDRFFIAIFISTVAVGHYQPAYQLAYLLFFLPKMAYVSLVPPLVRLVDAGRQADAEVLLNRFADYFLFFAIPFCAGALFTAPTILALLATTMVAKASPLVTSVVAVGGIFYGFSLLSSIAAFVTKQTGMIVKGGIAGAMTNISLNVLLLPRFPFVIVPAMTALAGFFVSATVMMYLMRRHWRLRVDWVWLPRFFGATAAMSALLWYIGFRPGQVATLHPAALLASILAAVALYLFAVAAIGGFSLKELRQIRQNAALD